MLDKIQNFALDTLFPIRCISCGEIGEWLCQNCSRKIPLFNEQRCPICEKVITPSGRTCFHCQKKYVLDGLVVATSYQHEIVSKLVHYYKYRFIENLQGVLGSLMIQALKENEISLPDLIIPVPLHPRRLRWRGFNQAEVLAAFIQKNLTPGFSIPMENNILMRNRYTIPQMKIKNYGERHKNIEQAFTIRKGSKNIIKNKHILLIDDIATTGSTLFECAKVLKKSGASEVFAIVIARQGK